MDHNIIIFTLIVFASMVMLLRFISALIYPFLILMGVFFIFYIIKQKLINSSNKNIDNSYMVEEREEGLNIKYSKLIIKLRNNFKEIKNSFINDKTVGPLIEDIEDILKELIEENVELGRRASQMEQYMSTIAINELHLKKAEYSGRIRVENDNSLKNEYTKALILIDEALANYAAGEKMIKLIDLEMARSQNYFDVVKLKIANLCITQNISLKVEIDEICGEINKLFSDIKKLKNNFIQISKEVID